MPNLETIDSNNVTKVLLHRVLSGKRDEAEQLLVQAQRDDKHVNNKDSILKSLLCSEATIKHPSSSIHIGKITAYQGALYEKFNNHTADNEMINLFEAYFKTLPEGIELMLSQKTDYFSRFPNEKPDEQPGDGLQFVLDP